MACRRKGCRFSAGTREPPNPDETMTLRPFSLVHDRTKDDWKLVNDQSGRTVQRFDTKTAATAGGVLSDAIGIQGGTVRIHLENGRIQEERTFPRSADPRSSEG